MARRPTRRRSRRLERWQVLLAAVVAAVASIIVALISLHSGGTTSVSVTTTQSPSVTTTQSASVSVAITSELERLHPPPPGRLYMWGGTVRNLPADASIFVIGTGENSGSWLVSPKASMSRNGIWAVTWVIPKPPTSVQWTAVVQIPSTEPCPPQGCPSPVALPFDLSGRGARAPGVLATATYRPKANP
jgi:hypothetical protein